MMAFWRGGGNKRKNGLGCFALFLRTGFPSSIDCGKGHEGAAEDDEVGEWKGKALPVNVEHFDCVFGGLLCRWMVVYLSRDAVSKMEFSGVGVPLR